MYLLSHLGCVWLFVTLWVAARQAPLSLGFFRQEYWSGLLCLPQGRSSCVQFSQYLLVWWSLYILFFSEWYFQILFFGSFLFQQLENIIPLSLGVLGFCWEICLDPNEGSLVISNIYIFVLASLFFPHAAWRLLYFSLNFATLYNVCCRGYFMLIWFGDL